MKVNATASICRLKSTKAWAPTSSAARRCDDRRGGVALRDTAPSRHLSASKAERRHQAPPEMQAEPVQNFEVGVMRHVPDADRTDRLVAIHRENVGEGAVAKAEQRANRARIG